MNTKHIIIIGGLIIFIILIGICLATIFIKDNDTIQINDIDVQQDIWGIYNLVGHITPEKDYSYLEARLTFYDDKGVIIGKSACVWNIVDVKAGTTLSLGNSLGCVCDGTPSRVLVEFYDSVSSNTPLKNFTIFFNGTNGTSSNTGNNNIVASNGSVKNALKGLDADDENEYNAPSTSTEEVVSSSSDYGGASSVGTSEGIPYMVETSGNLFLLFQRVGLLGLK